MQSLDIYIAPPPPELEADEAWLRVNWALVTVTVPPLACIAPPTAELEEAQADITRTAQIEHARLRTAAEQHGQSRQEAVQALNRATRAAQVLREETQAQLTHAKAQVRGHIIGHARNNM